MMLPGSYKLVDLNGDGVINTNDRYSDYWTTGSNPPIQYGLVLTGSYKNFDVNMLFQGASGYCIGYANDDVWGYGGRTQPTYLLKSTWIVGIRLKCRMIPMIRRQNGWQVIILRCAEI